MVTATQGSASYEAVNWKVHFLESFVSHLRSASYEAVNWKNGEVFGAYVDTVVSLVWGCELKGPMNRMDHDGHAVSLVWGCELKGSGSRLGKNWWRVSLVWGCELKGSSRFSPGHHTGSASYEAVNWKSHTSHSIVLTLWSASYEAVNWKTERNTGTFCHSRVSLVWGCELKVLLQNLPMTKAPVSLVWGCELKVTLFTYFFCENEGQPRMRLWIERRLKQIQEKLPTVSLVWGCELKDAGICPEWWIIMVSLVWGCELKVKELREKTELAYGQPRMRLWIERQNMLQHKT